MKMRYIALLAYPNQSMNNLSARRGDTKCTGTNILKLAYNGKLLFTKLCQKTIRYEIH